MEPMTSASATTRFIVVKQKRQFHRAKVPRFGNMATPKQNDTIGMKISAASVKWDVKHGSMLIGYHRRSLAETTMFRFKMIFGGKLRSRKFENQAVELFLQCTALNRMIQLGKPDSYKVKG